MAISDRLWPRTSWRSRAIRLTLLGDGQCGELLLGGVERAFVRRSADIANTVIPMIDTDSPWMNALAGSSSARTG